MATNTSATLAEYMALDEPDGPRFELDEGDLILSPSTTLKHNKVRDRLNARLDEQIEERGLGVVTSETDFLLGPATVRRPDIAIILAAHYQSGFDSQVPIPAAPDIAIEIVSPSDRAAEVLRKTQQYLRAGVQAIWLVYPALKTAHRWGGDSAAPRICCLGENWDEPELLPGVSIPLAAFMN